MHTRQLFNAFVLISFSLFLLGLLLFIPALAEETVNITTYYPSANGVYNALEANKLAVGDVEPPPADGQVYAARSVIYRPQSLPILYRREGELAYDSATDALYLYNNDSEWARQSGGKGCYVSYAPTGCIEGFDSKGSLGEWGACTYMYTSFFVPPGVPSCGFGVWVKLVIGEAELCCK